MKVAVHISHEALYKIGGIGEVLIGISTAPSYQNFFEKTLFYGPLFEYVGSASTRLGKDGIVYYSSKDNYDTGHFSQLFKPLLEKYHIDIVYGKRRILSEFNPSRTANVDVLLVDITQMKKDLIDFQKFLFWERFKLPSDKYERDWDYEQYFRLSLPYLEVLNLLYPKAQQFFHFSHEYMGIPCLLALELSEEFNTKKHFRIFYAHEIAPARRIVENLPGHDIAFYNLLAKAKESNQSLEDLFGSQMDWYRTALVKLAQRVERIFAVGDLVAEEYKFLCPEVDSKKIKVVYNGLFLDHISYERKLKSREKFKECLSAKGCEKIDIIISHTCRLVKSKGIWRDFRVLHLLDELLTKHNLKGIYILLATQVPQGRPPELIESMIKEYSWPFMHKVGWPDLIGYEIEIYELLKNFNEKAKAIKGIFINQFGLSKRKCGINFPEDITTLDLKIASDIELGLSIYEPFGISHIEVLPSGGLPILSTSCGVNYLLKRVFPSDYQPFIAINFIEVAKELPIEILKSLTPEKREILEDLAISKYITQIQQLIPKNEEERYNHFITIQKYLKGFDWEDIIKKYFFPALT
ncbi:MAG: hypothetical protein ACK40E_04890 [Caldimicrobium sp.]